MFIGHFGLGLAAKKVAPRVSLGFLFLAAQFLDLLWPTLLLIDVEHVEISRDPNTVIPFIFTDYPVSHSLLLVIGWGFLLGLIFWLVKKQTKNAFILGLLVVSHWFLDLIVHIPDLPLHPGNSPMMGWGLWRSKGLTALVEGSIFVLGLVIYMTTTSANNKIGSVGLLVLVILLVSTHFANIFGPPPTDVKTVAWSAQLQWLFVILAFWVDRNRMVISNQESPPI